MLLGVLSRKPSLVVLDLPFSEDILDDSKYHHAVTAVVGSPTFVGNRLFINNNTVLSVPFHPDFAFTNDFTIEGFIEPSGSCYILNRQEGSLTLRVLVTGANGLNVTLGNSFGVTYNLNSAANAVLLNQRQHFAIVRVGSVASLYLNGNLVASTTVTGAFFPTNVPLLIGAYWDGSNYVSKLTGYLDRFKITKKALYTANFTPPV